MPLKKALLLLFIGVLVLRATSGCTTQKTTQTAEQSAGQQKATDPISVTIKAAGSSMQVGSYHTPKSGYKYVLYDAAVKNNNINSWPINPSYFTLRTTDSQVYDVDYFAMQDSSIDGFKMITQTQPGDVVTGTIIYQIPQTATPKLILYNDVFHKITTNL